MEKRAIRLLVSMLRGRKAVVFLSIVTIITLLVTETLRMPSTIGTDMSTMATEFAWSIHVRHFETAVAEDDTEVAVTDSVDTVPVDREGVVVMVECVGPQLLRRTEFS